MMGDREATTRTAKTPRRRIPATLPDIEVRGGLGFLDRCDEWSFCLTAARMVAEQERR
jgi:hypothetical protein